MGLGQPASVIHVLYKYTDKRLQFWKDNLDGHFINSMNINIWALIMTLATYTKQDIKYQEQRLVPCLKPLILIPNSLIFKSFTFHQNISYNIPRNICNFLSLHGDFAAALEPQCLFYIILCIIVLSIPINCV